MKRNECHINDHINVQFQRNLLIPRFALILQAYVEHAPSASDPLTLREQTLRNITAIRHLPIKLLTLAGSRFQLHAPSTALSCPKRLVWSESFWAHPKHMNLYKHLRTKAQPRPAVQRPHHPSASLPFIGCETLFTEID